MKHIICIFSFILLTTTLSQAQIRFGLKAGLYSMDLDVSELSIDQPGLRDRLSLALEEANYGIQLGVTIRAYLSDNVILQPEILWNSNTVEFDVTLRTVDNSQLYQIPSYTTADLRLEWKPRSDLRFELIGQNLLDRGHIEFGSRILDVLPSRINSGIIGRITWAP